MDPVETLALPGINDVSGVAPWHSDELDAIEVLETCIPWT